jgi:CBS domain-containing protein
MKVSSILNTKGERVETIAPETRISSVVWTLRGKQIGALVVSEDGTTMLGMISERDVVRGLADHGTALLGMRVSDVMTRSVVTCAPEDSITRVMAEMTRHRVRHLPVVEHGRLLGIVSIGDVVKYRLDELEMEANILREALITAH